MRSLTSHRPRFSPDPASYSKGRAAFSWPQEFLSPQVEPLGPALQLRLRTMFEKHLYFEQATFSSVGRGCVIPRMERPKD